MSSESDIDEFYDAQDITPQRRASRLHSKNSFSESELLLDLEKEELQLLEQKKSIEDQRKLEEDEIQRKLASLDRKKQAELDRKAAARKARENELRRKKLEEMRMFMSDESTPDRKGSFAQCEKDVHELQTQFREDSKEDHQSTTHSHLLEDDRAIEEKLEALSFELEQSGHLNSADFARCCDTKYKPVIRASSHGSSLERTTCSIESDSFEDAAESTPSGASSNSHDKLSLSANIICGTHTTCFSQPQRGTHSNQLANSLSRSDANDDNESRRKSSSLPIHLASHSIDDNSSANSVDLLRSPVLQEPDIIQSTKSLPRPQAPMTSTPKVIDLPVSSGAILREPSRELGQDLTPEDGPVAPPRKRKSVKSEERQNASSAPTADVVGVSMRAGGVGLVSRPSLDLSSATQGNCHVVAMEDSATKGGEDEALCEEEVSVETTKRRISQKHDSRQLQGDRRSFQSQESLDDHDPEFDLDTEVTREDDDSDLDLLESHKESEAMTAAGDGMSAKKQDGQAVITGKTDHAPPSPFVVRQKSKTLGGTTEEMRRGKISVARVMSDKEILDQVMVTNLDTGEKITLSEAEDKMPPSMNPLSLHIMRLTKEYCSEPKSNYGTEKDNRDEGKTVKTLKVPKKRGKKIKKFLSKSVRRIKSELKSAKEDKNSSSDEDELVDGRRMIKIKASHSHKGPYDFDLLVPVQNLTEESGGAVWTMKFSTCGKLLATGGQDQLLKIWVLKSAYSYFDGMRQKYSEVARTLRSTSHESSQSVDYTDKDFISDNADEEEEDDHAPFMRRPFCVYRGHTADLLDVSWSKNYFILSSSMDKTVRLWHVSRKECLCCFQHIDFVTAIAFHPKDDRYFLSGSLDGKLRLWSIPEKKVALWNEVSGQSKLITAANFCSDGKIAVGTYDGRCVLYTADHLDYHTQIHVRSTRGKNAKGGKITGVEPYPAEHKILVTSNDSRIRLYDLRDKTLTCKYKGSANNSSRIKASFNADGRYIICGSEDGCVYIWRTQHDFYKFYSVRRDRNDFWEGVKAHIAVVTAAIFAPDPTLIIKPQFQFVDADDKEMTAGVRGEVMISADFTGAIKVFINKFKPGSG